MESNVDKFIKSTNVEGVLEAKKICKYGKKLTNKDKYRYFECKETGAVVVDESEGVDIYTPYFWLSFKAKTEEVADDTVAKYKVHVNEVGKWDQLSCNASIDKHFYVGNEIPQGRKLCLNCLRNRPELAYL